MTMRDEKWAVLLWMLCAPVVFAAEGDTQFRSHIVGGHQPYFLSIDAADLDGDGDVDLLAAASDSDTLLWLERTDTGCPPQKWCAHFLNRHAENASSIHAVDIDGDTRVDIVAAAPGDDSKKEGTGQVLLYHNTVAGFVEYVIETTTEHPIAVSSADINGDELIDLIVAYHRGEKIKWFENLGADPPAFAARSIDDTQGAFHCCVCDIDRDLDPDIVIADRDTDSIAWYQNNWPSPFVRRVVATDVHQAIAVSCGDINLDQRPDILAAGRGTEEPGEEGAVIWFEQSPDEPIGWTRHDIAGDQDGLLYAPKSVACADLDNDGLPDVVSASAGRQGTSAKILWHRQMASAGPSFEHIVIAEEPLVTGCRAVIAKDVNGDSIVDVASVGQAPNNLVVWHENLLDRAAILSAHSIRLHGEGGPYEAELAIDLIASGGSEPRHGGFDHLRFTANLAMDAGTVDCRNVQIDCDPGPAAACLSANIAQDPHIVDVQLEQPLVDGDCCTISFDGMLTQSGEPLTEWVRVRPLIGDIGGNGSVTGSDALLIKPYFGKIPILDSSDPRFDFDENGVVTGADFVLIKPLFGRQGEPCP